MFHIPAHLNVTHPAAQVAIAPYRPTQPAPVRYAAKRARIADRINTRQAEPDLARMFDLAYEDQCAAACGPGL